MNIGGIKVDPIFVERAIKSIDGIRDAIVNGIRNPILGEILIAEVITTKESGLSETIIRKRLSEQLDLVQIPAVIRIVENFTLNSNGKRGSFSE